MQFWNNFAAKHPAAAKWVREGGLFVIVSNLITVFKYLLLQFLPAARTLPEVEPETIPEHPLFAGDGGSGPGNATSIGIEICVDAGGDFEQAKANAASLVRLLMERHGIPLERVVQHNRWNGKDCPKTIRATAGAWEAFLALCGGQESQDTDPELEAAVDALVAAGIIDSPERWMALDYTANTVRLLLLKMGRYVTQ